MEFELKELDNAIYYYICDHEPYLKLFYDDIFKGTKKVCPDLSDYSMFIKVLENMHKIFDNIRINKDHNYVYRVNKDEVTMNRINIIESNINIIRREYKKRYDELYKRNYELEQKQNNIFFKYISSMILILFLNNIILLQI